MGSLFVITLIAVELVVGARGTAAVSQLGTSGQNSLAPVSEDAASPFPYRRLLEADVIALPTDIGFSVEDLPAEGSVSKPVSDAVTLEYYKNEPIFSLYLAQLPENMTAEQMVQGDECMTSSDAANLYRSKQNVINGGCFGDLDDQFDAVNIVGTVDDIEPESFQVVASEDPNQVTLQRFLGSKQCEACLDDRCVGENFTLPVNTCYYWESPAAAGANFFVVVSRTNPMADVAFNIYTDDKCAEEYKSLKGGGADMCIGGAKPSPGTDYDEGFEFRKVVDMGNQTVPVDSYDISRWIRGTECKEGFRSNFMGTAKKETVRVQMNKCTPWSTTDDRTFFVKTTFAAA